MDMDELRLHPSEAKEVQEAARMIHHLLNVGFTGHGPKALALALANDHRTLVQGCMRDLVLPFIGFLAEQGRAERYDARNEGAVKLAMALQKTVSANSDIYLPHI